VWQQVLAGTAPASCTGDCLEHLDHCAPCQAVVEELTQGGRTWLDLAAELRQPAPDVPPACRRALEEISTAPPHEKWQAMTARIHLERMMHRSSIAVAGDAGPAYALVKLIPTGPATDRPLGVNLALALDVSGSMYEEDGTGVSRLARVQEAALDAVGKLRPEDTLAVIAFAHNARVLLPPTPLADWGRIENVIRGVDRFDVDPGGTAMDEGLALALTSVERHAAADTLSQIVLLTDGETTGEQNCRALARKAADKRIRLTLMGVGLDWKAALLKELANLGQGKWYYIDAEEARSVTCVFAEEFESLAAAAFLDVQMHLRPVKDVGVKRLRQVVPEIREIGLEATEAGALVGRLGTLPHGASARYILDLSLPPRPDGKYAVAQFEVTYDPGTGRRESCGPVPLEIAYTAAGHGYGNAEVMKHIDEIQFKEKSDELVAALRDNNRQAAVALAQELKRKATQLGVAARQKTQIATRVLEELNAEGHVTKKTELIMEDVARRPEGPLPPP
jgi:Ca-activated chloride channel family protein